MEVLVLVLECFWSLRLTLQQYENTFQLRYNGWNRLLTFSSTSCFVVMRNKSMDAFFSCCFLVCDGMRPFYVYVLVIVWHTLDCDQTWCMSQILWRRQEIAVAKLSVHGKLFHLKLDDFFMRGTVPFPVLNPQRMCVHQTFKELISF